MKKIICSLSLILLFVSVFLLSGCDTVKPIDYIHSFEINVTTNDDATLNFEYRIKWEIIDGSNSDPLTFVRIGTPNSEVDNVEIISTDTITDIYKYNNGDNDTGLKVMLDRKYYKGEKLDLAFSFHQKKIFTYGKDEDVELVTFQYVPCWFDDIEVGKVVINWDKANVYFNDAMNEDDTNLIWTFKNLKKGEKVEINVSYASTYFPNADSNKQYNSMETPKKIVIIIWCVIIALIIIFTIISRIFRRASYYSTRGFFPIGRMTFNRAFYYGVNNKGERRTNPYISRGSGGSHSSHSCACACACACAGGGRAGCSKKDFYKGNIKIDDLIDKM